MRWWRAIAVLLVNVAVLEGLLWTLCPLPFSLQRAVTKPLSQTLPGLKPHIVFAEDAFGFRSRSMRTIRKPPRTIRIICLGASTTQQPTQSTEDLWSAIVERKLQERFQHRGVRIEVAALGSGGLTVFDGVRHCELTLPPYEPDIVITLWGVNDLAWHGGSDYRYPDPSRTATTAGWKRTLRRYSQLYRRFRQFERVIKVRRSLQEGSSVEWSSESLPALRASYVQYPADEAPVRDPDPIVEFSDGIKRLIGCLKRQGSDVIVLAQPVLWKAALSEAERKALWFFVNTPQGRVRPSPRWLAREMDRYNEVQRQHAARLGASYVPLDRLIPKTLDDFYDDCHVTDQGSAAVAEAVWPTVQQVVEQVLERRSFSP